MRKCAQPRTMLPWSVESNRAHLPAIWMAFTSVIKLSSFCTCCSFLSFTVVSNPIYRVLLSWLTAPVQLCFELCSLCFALVAFSNLLGLGVWISYCVWSRKDLLFGRTGNTIIDYYYCAEHVEDIYQTYHYIEFQEKGQTGVAMWELNDMNTVLERHSKAKATVKRTERKGETFTDMFPPTAGNFNKIENVLFNHSQGQSYCVGKFYVSLVAFPNSILFAAIQDYRTFSIVSSQQFSPFIPIIPCADWGTMCYCKMEFILVYTVLLMVLMLQTAENKQQRMYEQCEV